MNAFDVIIIGFGKGGKTLAAEFAKRGQKVAIIERSDKMYGGTCINIGCIPTKTLVHQAKMASALKDATFEERSEFYRNAVSVKESVTSALRNKNYHNLADSPNVTVYTGIGSFVSCRCGCCPHGYGRNTVDIKADHYQYGSGNGDSSY